MSSEEMKGNLLRPSVLTLYEMRIFMSRTHSTESTSLKISIETPLETLPQVLYPNKNKCGFVVSVMGFSLVGHRAAPLSIMFYERVELDMEFCLENNITLFYKSFVLPCLLGYREIF